MIDKNSLMNDRQELIN